MQQLIDLYNQFLAFFPDQWHPYVSLAVIVAMIIIVLRFWKVGVLGILFLIIFVPASIPVLKSLLDTLLGAIKH